MSRLRIYFAGSIRGGREDRALYRDLVARLGRYGDVLTEHVGDANLTETGEEGSSDREIFERDLTWLRSSDAVVAEISTPSLGVGYEVAVAEQLGKPILCLYHGGHDRKLSAMLAGNPRLTVLEYRSPIELEAHLEAFLSTGRAEYDGDF